MKEKIIIDPQLIEQVKYECYMIHKEVIPEMMAIEMADYKRARKMNARDWEIYREWCMDKFLNSDWKEIISYKPTIL